MLVSFFNGRNHTFILILIVKHVPQNGTILHMYFIFSASFLTNWQSTFGTFFITQTIFKARNAIKTRLYLNLATEDYGGNHWSFISQNFFLSFDVPGGHQDPASIGSILDFERFSLRNTHALDISRIQTKLLQLCCNLKDCQVCLFWLSSLLFQVFYWLGSKAKAESTNAFLYYFYGQRRGKGFEIWYFLEMLIAVLSCHAWLYLCTTLRQNLIFAPKKCESLR